MASPSNGAGTKHGYGLEVSRDDSPDLEQPRRAGGHGVVDDDHQGDFVTLYEERDLSRGLHQRHVSLIALAGAIVSLGLRHLSSTFHHSPSLYQLAGPSCLFNLILLQGTGLFLGLGSSIQTGGPLGALLGYATIGLIVCAVQFALGEVTALLPVTGSFVRHAEFLVDPALGFAIG